MIVRPIATGIQGFDRILGGGFPELSFNLIAGGTGTGKTTMAHQLAFSHATEEKQVLYVMVMGEPPLKMLRYQQQFDFFDPDAVGRTIHFHNLSEDAAQGGLERVLERIAREVERLEPGIVVVDSFRSLVRTAASSEGDRGGAQVFVERLARRLTTWEATTFLVGEFRPEEAFHNPVFTVADGVIELFQVPEGDTVVRKLRVRKLRGQEHQPGLHAFRITRAGLRVFSRMPEPFPRRVGGDNVTPRLRWGVPGLDALTGGGLPRGDSVILTGPSGSGKSALCLQFVRQGIEDGENSVIMVFEEHPDRYADRARDLDLDLERLEEEGCVRILYFPMLDLHPDEAFEELRDAVLQLEARRVVIDSLSGLQVAAANITADRLRESLFRMIGALTRQDTTIMMTVENRGGTHEFRNTPYEVSILADNLIVQRHVDIQGELEKVMTVVKMRRSGHSRSLQRYEVTERGVVIRAAVRELGGIPTGASRADLVSSASPEDREALVGALRRAGAATVSELMAAADLDESAIWRELVHLEASGRVAIEYDGDLTRFRLAAEGKSDEGEG